MNKISGITTVCFDIDWTLVSHDENEEANTLKLLGLEPNDDFTRQIRFFWDNVSKKLQNGRPVTKEYLCLLADRMIPYLRKHDIKPILWLNAANKCCSTKLMEGAEEILDYLQNEGYYLICSTNWFAEEQVKVLKEHGIFYYFEKIYGWDTICAKPNRRALGSFVQNVGNDSIVFVGDSVETDILFANRLGIKSFGINLKHNKNNMDVKSTYNISSLLEIKNYL